MRPSRDQWALTLAYGTSKQSTCLRRQVGCVLLNKLGHVLATGYNGVAAGLPHCNEEKIRDNSTGVSFPNACPEWDSKSGTNLDGCRAIHAEQNALLQCSNVQEIETCYCTASPCITCTKLLLNTSCQRIVFCEPYPHNQSESLWVMSGREWWNYQGVWEK